MTAADVFEFLADQRGDRTVVRLAGDAGPDTRSGLAVSLAGQPVRLSGKFLSPAVMLWSGH